MPLPKLNDPQYLEKQYQDSSNLDARIQLHQRFSVNPYGWHPWVFDHFDLPAYGRILELGCGPGYLWLENLGRIPTGWEITLSDFSAGMLEETRRNLENQRTFQFKLIDAQSIPCEDAYFDAVIANHMLYHVPNPPAALSEICRVLKPAGHFYAATNGARHMSEMAALLTKFDVGLASWGNKASSSFTLENGLAQLSQWFAEVKLYRYEDALEVTEVDPLVDYILSGRVGQVLVGRQPAFREFVAREMESHGGVFHITEAGGLFVSVPKGE
jgi:ubiquinone/menaquinone biosynthesis C-methylase UbiE